MIGAHTERMMKKGEISVVEAEPNKYKRKEFKWRELKVCVLTFFSFQVHS